MTSCDVLIILREFFVKVSAMRKAQKDLQISYTVPRRQIATRAEKDVDLKISELEKFLWSQQSVMESAGKVKE